MAEQHIVLPSPIHQLNIRGAFEGLNEREKLYAHHMSRAAWHGARIVLRQTSPEAVSIFDFIIELYKSCSGSWDELASRCKVSPKDMSAFLDYAAAFLSNLGNYYGSGDQKFIPNVGADILERLSSVSSRAEHLYQQLSPAILSLPPFSLGFPSNNAQSMYYPGDLAISKDEIQKVSAIMEKNSILPENTRIWKTDEQGKTVFKVLQASSNKSAQDRQMASMDTGLTVHLRTGNHSEELGKICLALKESSKYAANATQREFLSQYIESFETGDLEVYRASQRSWVRDVSPRVENIFGFVEPYRDPLGIRAEFEGLVAINDPEETKLLARLVQNSSTFIRRLPWAEGTKVNDGKGPFEKELFEPPDFTSIHSLAYCSSIIFPGINLPNYNDIRQECGFKNVIVANRMAVESSTADVSPFVDPAEADVFHKHKYAAYYLWVVLHEVVGHGTSKLMQQYSDGTYNFDINNRPINPLTNKPITRWYLPGQTWTGQFADLATTVDECRAELVGAYLMDDKELLRLFGYDDKSEITAEDLTYNAHMQLGVDGLRGLQNFNTDDQKWGQVHSRAHFATLKCLLRDGNGFMKIDFDQGSDSLTVRVDRSRILTDGIRALGTMLLRLHMYRCTADVEACRSYYEDLSKVNGEYLDWRKAVMAKRQPKWGFGHANTFLDEDKVRLEEYPATKEGVVESWVKRDV